MRSNSRPYIRFALISFALVAVVAAAAVIFALRLAAAKQEEAAARSAATLIAGPVAGILDGTSAGGPLTASARAELESATAPLLEGAVRHISVYADTRPVYTAGDATALTVTSSSGEGGLEWRRATSEDGETLQVTQTTRGAYTVVVAQSAGPIDHATRTAQLEAGLTIFIFAALLWSLLQGAFWLGIRRYTSDHESLVYLYDTGLQLRSSLDLHDVLNRLAGDATALASGRYGFVALYDEETADVTLRTVVDAATGEVALHQRPVDEWYMRRCIATATTVVSAQGAAAFKQVLGPDVEIDRTAALLCVPMLMRERVVGAIAVVRTDNGLGAGFTPSEVRMVQELAAQAVTAVEQAILFAKVRADANQIEASYDSTLKALMAALEAKDDVTEGHCERVARLTVQLAKALNVPPAMLVHIERGALLHDVGKIGVPDGILKKPNGLNEGEWEAMRKHPLLAGLMVSKIGFLEPALPILLYHHERFDGTGYPFGLLAESIPLEARIFTVIDAYDAMTSDRPYRPAMSHEAALTEILKHAGTQFDPDVVDAFERLISARPDLRAHVGQRISGLHDDEVRAEDMPPGEHAA